MAAIGFPKNEEVSASYYFPLIISTIIGVILALGDIWFGVLCGAMYAVTFHFFFNKTPISSGLAITLSIVFFVFAYLIAMIYEVNVLDLPSVRLPRLLRPIFPISVGFLVFGLLNTILKKKI